jgi:hypothetical protein
MLFIYGEPTGVKHTIPKAPDLELQAKLIKQLHSIKQKVHGEIKLDPKAYDLLDKIYKSDYSLHDPRFEAYESRRLQHLLKLCIVIAASKEQTEITEDTVVHANTVLTITDHLMPRALGEFGRAKNSTATHKVMDIINKARFPVSFQAIWQQAYQDIESRNMLMDILGNLTVAHKIQSVGNEGFLPVKKVAADVDDATVNWDLLTKHERDMI